MSNNSKNAVNAFLMGHITKKELIEKVKAENPSDLKKVKEELAEYAE